MAEGVETQEILDWLTAMWVAILRKSVISNPLPTEDLT